ncbi:hypothetical protein AC578_2720 [Pseudocercospora eumusae]|uniref:Uncharacterized protein n=1 Tax=Pseudocercospora eumusae TaxID=321146 RepID=A0A139HFT6_9PEZI|nr:hypothetical protein AC578_2720 [Pseudocercospora eumusae]
MAIAEFASPPTSIPGLITLAIIILLSLSLVDRYCALPASGTSSIRQGCSRRLQHAFDTVSIKIISWFPNSKLHQDHETVEDIWNNAPGWLLFLKEGYLGRRGYASRIFDLDLDAPDIMRLRII